MEENLIMCISCKKIKKSNNSLGYPVVLQLLCDDCFYKQDISVQRLFAIQRELIHHNKVINKLIENSTMNLFLMAKHGKESKRKQGKKEKKISSANTNKRKT